MPASVALKMKDDAPFGAAKAFVFHPAGNGNLPRVTKPRRPAMRPTVSPEGMRNLAQRLEAADGCWQEVWKAHCKRNSDQDGSDDAVLLASFACFIHTVIDDRNLCGRMLHYLNEKLEAESADRQEPVK